MAHVLDKDDRLRSYNETVMGTDHVVLLNSWCCWNGTLAMGLNVSTIS